MSCESRWRDWNNVVISQGIPKIFRNNQKESILSMFFSLLLSNHLSVSDSLRPHGCSTPRFLSFTTSSSQLEFISIVSDVIQPCCPLSSPSLTFNFPSIRVFPNESVLRIRWPKCWTFSFNINLSKEYSGLISFMIDWFERAHCRQLDFETVASKNVKE